MDLQIRRTAWANNKLRLVMTSACNINCFYCHNEGQAKADDFLSIDLLERIVQLLGQGAPRSITLTGGEALLHPEFLRVIERLKPTCSELTLVTNGLLLTKTRIDEIVGAGVTKVRLGVDSLSQTKSRPSSGVFPPTRILDVIDFLLASSLTTELNIVLTKYNVGEIPKLFRFCRERRLSAKIFEHLEVVQFATAMSLAVMSPTAALPFEAFCNLLRESGIKFRIEDVPELQGANTIIEAEGFIWRYCRYLCPFGLCNLTGTRIAPDGTTYACMEKRFTEKISASESLALSMKKVAEVTSRGCSHD